MKMIMLDVFSYKLRYVPDWPLLTFRNFSLGTRPLLNAVRTAIRNKVLSKRNNYFKHLSTIPLMRAFPKATVSPPSLA